MSLPTESGSKGEYVTKRSCSAPAAETEKAAGISRSGDVSLAKSLLFEERRAKSSPNPDAAALLNIVPVEVANHCCTLKEELFGSVAPSAPGLKKPPLGFSRYNGGANALALIERFSQLGHRRIITHKFKCARQRKVFLDREQ